MNPELKKILGIAAGVLVVAGFFFVISQPSEPVKPVRYDEKVLVREDSAVSDTADTPVTLVEFGDFQCPACATIKPVVDQLVDEYSGRLKLVFRHYPLLQHKNARISASAAEAAGEQGKFWEMYGKLYNNQNEWAETTNPLEFFMKYAQEIGLNADQFRSAVEQNKFESKINRDAQDGNAVNVTGTPTFYINGYRVDGNMSYANLKLVIEQALSGEIEKNPNS